MVLSYAFPVMIIYSFLFSNYGFHERLAAANVFFQNHVLAISMFIRPDIVPTAHAAGYELH